MSHCGELLRGVAQGVIKAKLTGVHVVVFFDWCCSLKENGNKEVTEWWNYAGAFDRLKKIENCTLLGWTTSPTSLEASKEMAWLSSYDDLLSNDALNFLTSGAGAPVRRLIVQCGKLVSKDDDVFGLKK